MIFNSPFIDNIQYAGEEEKEPEVEQRGEDNQEVPVTKMSHSTTLEDMVEDASKAIVGVVNYGEQINPFNPGGGGDGKSGTGSGVIFKKEEIVHILSQIIM